jgi:hypothetical protein
MVMAHPPQDLGLHVTPLYPEVCGVKYLPPVSDVQPVGQRGEGSQQALVGGATQDIVQRLFLRGGLPGTPGVTDDLAGHRALFSL